MTTQTITIPPIEIPACGDNAVISINISVAVTSPCVVGGGGDTGGGAAPEWLPQAPGGVAAIKFADFAGGHYYELGATSTLGSMFTENTDWGGWDPSGVVLGTGLTHSYTSPVFKNAGDILAGATFVLEFETHSDNNDILELIYETLPTFSDEYAMKCQQFSYTRLQTYSDLPSDEPGATYPLSAGTHKVAVTIADGSKIAASRDGGAVWSLSPATLVDAKTHVIMNIANGATLKSVAVYPVLADADLPTLSTVA